MKIIGLLLFLIIGTSGCRHSTQAALYRVCWTGPFTGDLHCGSPIARQTALDAVQAEQGRDGIKYFVIKDAGWSYRMAGSQRPAALPDGGIQDNAK